eukprot:11217660-Lingulodinium_polyedra.AAC.1
MGSDPSPPRLGGQEPLRPHAGPHSRGLDGVEDVREHLQQLVRQERQLAGVSAVEPRPFASSHAFEHAADERHGPRGALGECRGP